MKAKHSLEEIFHLTNMHFFLAALCSMCMQTQHESVCQEQAGRAALPLEVESKWASYKQADLSGQYDIPPLHPPTHNTRRSDSKLQCQALIRALGLPMILTDMRGMWFIFFVAWVIEGNHGKWCERFWSKMKINKKHSAGICFTYQRLAWQHLQL